MFAPLPGVSRSGLTIAAALALGFSRTWAVGFSLLIAVPAICGAAVFELKDAIKDPAALGLTPDRIAQTLAATVVAGLVGYLAILWLIRVVRAGRLWYFSVYLIALGSSGPGSLLDVRRIADARRREGSGPDRRARRSGIGSWTSLGRSRRALWIVPTPLARDQVRAGICRRSRQDGRPGPGSCAGTISGGWFGARPRTARSWLSEPAARAVFREAIRQAREAGELDAIEVGQLVGLGGYQRRLRAAVPGLDAAGERSRPGPGRRRTGDPGRAPAEAAIFVRYRPAPDAARRRGRRRGWRSGLRSGWSAARGSGPRPRDPAPVVIPRLRRTRLPASTGGSSRKPSQTGRPVHVDAGATSPTPTLAEVYAGHRGRPRTAARAGARGDAARCPRPARPPGLRAVERALFREPRPRRASPRSRSHGLAIRGAPQWRRCRRVAWP